MESVTREKLHLAVLMLVECREACPDLPKLVGDDFGPGRGAGGGVGHIKNSSE